MIDFKTNRDDVKRAVFIGGLDDLIAELLFEVSVLYGSIAQKNEEAAAEFKELFLASVNSKLGQSIIFDPSIAKAILSNGDYVSEIRQGDADAEDLVSKVFQSFAEAEDEDE